MRVKYKWISGNSQPFVGLWMFHGTNSNANCVGVKKVDVKDKTGKWVEIVITATVPKGADLAEIQIGNNSGSNVTYKIDNVSLVNFNDTYKLYENFENFNFDSNLNPKVPLGPIGWTDSDPANGSAVMSYSGNYQNSYSMFLQTDNTWIKSREFDVQEGYYYLLEYYAKKAKNNSEMTGTAKVVFLDADGEEVGVEEAVAGKNYFTWTKEYIIATAPAGADKAYVLFSCETANGTYGIDNVTVSESAEPPVVEDDEPEEPDGPIDPDKLLQNGSFDDGVAHWGVYADEPSSVTVVDGVANLAADTTGITLSRPLTPRSMSWWN